MNLREKFELLECNCDADHREKVRAEYLHKYGMEPPDLTLQEVLGSHDCAKYKLGECVC